MPKVHLFEGQKSPEQISQKRKNALHLIAQHLLYSAIICMIVASNSFKQWQIACECGSSNAKNFNLRLFIDVKTAEQNRRIQPNYASQTLKLCMCYFLIFLNFAFQCYLGKTNRKQMDFQDNFLKNFDCSAAESKSSAQAHAGEEPQLTVTANRLKNCCPNIHFCRLFFQRGAK